MKKFFNILLYLSFIFVVIYLFNFDYLEVEWTGINYLFLVISTLLLWAGMVLSTFSWWNALRAHGMAVPAGTALVSHGMAVFTKYIPGKIWTILSRASYIASESRSMKDTSIISLKEQLVYVWVGLALGSVPMLLIYGFNKFSIPVLAIFIALSFFLFSSWFHNFILKIINRILKREIVLPVIKSKGTLSIVVFCLLYWIVWMAGFYLFSLSFYPESSIGVAFAFPLSVTLGLLALFVPGGIGVREGIILAYLTQSGIPVKDAGLISVMARLWFITGEVFIFFLAYGIKRGLKKV